MKTSLSIILFLLGLIGNLNAQQLQQPLVDFPLSNKGYALLKSGDVVEGKIINYVSTRGITRVSLEDQTGNTFKINAEDIYEFAIAMNGAVRFQFAMERGSSVKKLLSRDQPTAKPKDYIIYRNTSINGEKEFLLQLLNPDFDEVFEVFFDPLTRKTTALQSQHIAWTGDKHRVYFISKNGSPLIKVKKGNYKKIFPTLFGDCSSLLTEVKKPKLANLGNHILWYQNKCSFD
ncbi:hypothetical protein [Algoriphagus hitonicola]|uniref:hypothetical protein n=1 Tax=Algoriphagus hitonicola TaxID=435880 RepID=UPI000B815546|nr:hypothetical protein [Algoriphagus hitonicola]